MFNFYRNLVSYEGNKFFPLCEMSEDGDIIGPGHQDHLAFATAASSFLDCLGVEDTFVNPNDVKHQWASVVDDDFIDEIYEDKTSLNFVPVTVFRW